MKPTLTHLALHVRDLDACIGFYQRFCGLHVIRQRGAAANRIVWMAEHGRETELLFVLLPGGPGRPPAAGGYGRPGIAPERSEAAVALAERCRAAGDTLRVPRPAADTVRGP